MMTFAFRFLLVIILSVVISVPEPCLDSFVFLRVKERQENILVEPETDDQRYVCLSKCLCPLGGSVAFPHLALLFSAQTLKKLMLLLSCVREYVVDLEEGSQHLMRYRTIAPLISSGAVQLI